MSALSYLESKASAAVLSDAEKASIATSISTLESRLDSYFTNRGDGLTAKFKFGSSTRGTILPRSIDAHSDIDFMVVFEKSGYTPQTYLDRLKRFVEKRYSNSEIYQSNPTIVLELNHIKFELVPALVGWWNEYRIPDGACAWRNTDPKDFTLALEHKNKNNASLLKPTIRLAKIWNASNGYLFDSYLFEKWIANLSFRLCFNQKEYLFNVFDNLRATEVAQWRNERIKKAKGIVDRVRQLERNQTPYLAEIELKKLIPG